MLNEPQMVEGHSHAIKWMELMIHKATISLDRLCLLRAKLPQTIGGWSKPARSTSLFPVSSINGVPGCKEWLLDTFSNHFIFQNASISWSDPGHMIHFPDAGCHLSYYLDRLLLCLFILYEQYDVPGGRESRNENIQKVNKTLKCASLERNSVREEEEISRCLYVAGAGHVFS